jgi:TolA-binding protein
MVHGEIIGQIVADIDIPAIWLSVTDFFRDYVVPGWVEFKWFGEHFVYFLAGVAAIGVLWRIKKIITLVQEIRASRGNIWDLKDLAQLMGNNAATIKANTDEMKGVLATIEEQDLVETVKGLVESLDAVQQQLTDLQRNSDASAAARADAAVEVREKVRQDWTAARDGLDEIINAIPDGRKRRAYKRLNRRSYSEIINKLLDEGFINEAIAVAARVMNGTYLYRNPITAEQLQRFRQAKQDFDNAIKNFKPSPRSPPPVSNRKSQPNGQPPKSGANGNGQQLPPNNIL